MALGLKGSIKNYSRLAADDSPQHYMSPFQRQDMYNRVASLADAKRGQAESAVAHRTGDTSSPQFQMQMNKLAEGTAGVVGMNAANVEQQDLQMGAEQRQRKLANLAQSIQMKQQFTQMKEAQAAASKKPEESASDKFLGKYTLGGMAAKKAGMSPTQALATAAGAAAGGPMGASMGSQAGAQLNAMQTGEGKPGAGSAAGATGMMSGTNALNTAGGVPSAKPPMPTALPKVQGTAPDAGAMSGVDWQAMLAKINGMPTMFGPGTTYQ